MLLTKFGVIPSQNMGGVWLDGWNYGKRITVPANSIDVDLTNFPLTVYLNNTNFDFTKAKTNGHDIRFTDKDLNFLKFERKEHDGTTNLKAVYNVQLPTVSNLQDSEIFLWYGNPNAYNTSIEAWQDMTGKQLTYNGNVKIVRGSPSYASFDGTGDYFTIPDNDDWYFGSSNLTVEAWIKRSVVNVEHCIFGQCDTTFSSGANVGSVFEFDSTNHLVFMLYSGSTQKKLTSTAVISDTSSWHHVCFVRNGNIGTLYIDGVASGTIDYGAGFTANNSAYKFVIGKLGESSYAPYNGNIYGLRITKGRARYTSNFTPPTSFAIDGTDVVFCTNFDTVYDNNYAMVQHMGDTLVDASGNGNNGTATGTTVVNTEFGKARSFNGSTDKIIITQSTVLNSATFTALSFNKLNVALASQTNNYPTLIDKRGTNVGFAMYYDKPTNKFTASHGNGSSLYNIGTTMDFNPTDYNIINVKHDGSSRKIYFSGILKDSYVGSYSNGSENVALGSFDNASDSALNGSIVETRISNIARSDAWISAESKSLKNQLIALTDL